MAVINLTVESVTIDGDVVVSIPGTEDVPQAVRCLTVGLDPLREAAIGLLATSPGLSSDIHRRHALKAARQLVDQARNSLAYGYRLTGQVDEGALAHLVDLTYDEGSKPECEAIIGLALAEDETDLSKIYLAITYAVLAAGLYDHGEDA